MVVGFVFVSRRMEEVIVPNTSYLGHTIVLSLSATELLEMKNFARIDYEKLENSLLQSLKENLGMEVSSLDQVLLLVDDGSKEEISAKYSKLENVIILGKPKLV